MNLSSELQWRGFVNQTTLTNIKELDSKQFKLYFGVDPSSDSMTVGNLAAAMMVKAFLRHNHDVTLLIGGATGLIGDPADRKDSRESQTEERIIANKKAIVGQYHRLFGQNVRVVDNYDWLKDINYIDFLRDFGVHFSLTPLLQRDYVASRIGPDGTGMSYAEFSYSLIQGYDFYHLNKTYGIDLQVCGSDQWGNSLSGVDLIRRKSGQQVHVYSVPLVINKTTGVKFGKSEGGAVWLDPKKTSVFKFYQFWLNIEDDTVSDYLKIFTELDKAKISKIMTSFQLDKANRLAQKTLAYEATKIVHGVNNATSVTRITETLFGSGMFLELDKEELLLLKTELTVVKANSDDSIETILTASGLASSMTEAKRLVKAGSIAINDNKLDEQSKIILIKGCNLFKRGKNNFVLVDCT